MAFRGVYEGMDDFDFFLSLTHTGSTYQPFYDDDQSDSVEATLHLPPTSIVTPQATSEIPRLSPVFCDTCGYTLEKLGEACFWCQFINDEVPRHEEHATGHPQDLHNQRDDNIRGVPVSRQARLHHDFGALENFSIDQPAPATSSFRQSSMSPPTSSQNLNTRFRDEQMWDQMLLDEEISDILAGDDAHQHQEDIRENQVPLHYERVLDQELNEVNIRVPRRRRLLAGERREVAAKRGKVCTTCRRMKRKVRQIRIMNISITPFPSYILLIMSPKCKHVDLEGRPARALMYGLPPHTSRPWRLNPAICKASLLERRDRGLARTLEMPFSLPLLSFIYGIMTFLFGEVKLARNIQMRCHELLLHQEASALSAQSISIQALAERKELLIKSAQHVGLVSHGRGAAWTLLNVIPFIPGCTAPKLVSKA
jgi:hypothetical protein